MYMRCNLGIANSFLRRGKISSDLGHWSVIICLPLPIQNIKRGKYSVTCGEIGEKLVMVSYTGKPVRWTIRRDVTNVLETA